VFCFVQFSIHSPLATLYTTSLILRPGLVSREKGEQPVLNLTDAKNRPGVIWRDYNQTIIIIFSLPFRPHQPVEGLESPPSVSFQWTRKLKLRPKEMMKTMLLDWTEGPLAEGLRCYHRQEFFLAHEHWEGVWLACEEPDKTFLQALIQIAAAFHHLQRRNVEGTSSLLHAALRRLAGFSANYGGIAVKALRKDVETWLEALSSEGGSPQIPFPPIRESGEARGVLPIE